MHAKCQTRIQFWTIKGELYASVDFIFFPLSSLLCLPPPTSPPGKNYHHPHHPQARIHQALLVAKNEVYICFQFSGPSHFNQSARGSFGDSLAELDTSVGVSELCPNVILLKCSFAKQLPPIQLSSTETNISQRSKAKMEWFPQQLISGDPRRSWLAGNKRQHNSLLHIWYNLWQFHP